MIEHSSPLLLMINHFLLLVGSIDHDEPFFDIVNQVLTTFDINYYHSLLAKRHQPLLSWLTFSVAAY